MVSTSKLVKVPQPNTFKGLSTLWEEVCLPAVSSSDNLQSLGIHAAEDLRRESKGERYASDYR